MWGADGKLHDIKAVIPDRAYARIYQEVINFCKANGAFDPRTMGTVPNVGLMAQQAEEYGSHDKTFEIPEAGRGAWSTRRRQGAAEQAVEAGDIWRMCQVKDAAIRDWVKLAVTRARVTGTPAVFWLDPYRAARNRADQEGRDLPEGPRHRGLDIRILSPVRAMRYTLERASRASTPSPSPATCCATT